jgi:hypothetical protein
MFAVSTGQQSMVKILVAAGASVSERDRFHNTAQHFAVIHAMPRMYTYITDLLGSDWRPQKNVYGLSPMTLAVHLNKLNMFVHICAVQQRIVWAFGPITCYDVPLVRKLVRLLCVCSRSSPCGSRARDAVRCPDNLRHPRLRLSGRVRHRGDEGAQVCPRNRDRDGPHGHSAARVFPVATTPLLR